MAEDLLVEGHALLVDCRESEKRSRTLADGPGKNQGGCSAWEREHVPLGARRASSSAFQYFLIWASETLAAFSRTGSSASLFRLVLRFGVLGLAGEGWMITSEVSITSSGSGVDIDVMAFEAGSESFDFFDGTTVLAFVILEGLLLKERVDCCEDWEEAPVGAPDLRRVAGIAAVQVVI